MIACTRCQKENQDHYKFCLGCGAELPRDAAKAKAAQKPATPPSGFEKRPVAASAATGMALKAEVPKAAAPAGAPAAKGDAVPSFGGAPAKNAPPPAASKPVTAGETATCEKCAKVNPASFKFCGACGHNLQAQKKAPSAPAPAPAPISSVPAEPVAAVSPSTEPQRGSLVIIRPDGTEGESFPLSASRTVVGRKTGGVFATDAYLSPEHALFAFEGDSLTVTDRGSLNGVYWRAEAEVPVPLEDGTVFRIGQEVIRFTKLPASQSVGGVDVAGSPSQGLVGRIALVLGRETTGNAYCVPADGLHLGRERGDIIFPEDGYVSGLHCRVHSEKGGVALTDVGSSNGTFIRVREKLKVPSGMLLLMGQQLFRVEY